MKFGTLPVDEALGAILAHAVQLGQGRLAKGRTLTADDLRALRSHGIDQVTVARLDPDDVSEDAAAHALATHLAGAGLRVGAAATGRCNLYAIAAGIARIDSDAIARVNRVDERLTVATVAPDTVMAAGAMVATVKIIPYAVPGALLTSACAAAAGRTAIAMAPFRSLRFLLVQTRLPALKPVTLDKMTLLTRARVERLGGTLIEAPRVPHETAALADALRHPATCDVVLIAAASATADRADTIPAAIVAAGGRVERVGMPVDPGNLLCLGHLGPIPVVGMPGCARSPKRNGLDWVLERIAAGLPLDSAVIAGLGVGGLLDDIVTRPQPRDLPASAVDPGGGGPAAPPRPRIAALILGAGLSTRMQGQNKLLADLAGRPVIRHVAETLIAAGLEPPLVVVGPGAAPLMAALDGLGCRFASNPAPERGLASSLRSGMEALLAEQRPDGPDAVLICLGDMPDLAPAVVAAIAGAFDPASGEDIIVPVFAGRRGNPVLWGRRHLADLMALSGDIGGKVLLAGRTEAIRELAVTSDLILNDIDTPDDLTAARIRRSGA